MVRINGAMGRGVMARLSVAAEARALGNPRGGRQGRGSVAGRLILFLVLIGGLTAPAAHAGIIVDNLSETPQANSSSAFFNSNGKAVGQNFTIGSTSYTLTDIAINAGGLSGSAAGLSAMLMADAGGEPGSSLITSFLIPDLSGPVAARTFTPVTPGVTLAANTTYWFVLANFASNAGTGLVWSYPNNTNSFVGPGGTIPSNSADTSTGGSTWTTYPDGGAYTIRVNGEPFAAVPEPSTLAACGWVGLLIAGGVARRVRRARAA